jgi:microcystin-dependent protein
MTSIFPVSASVGQEFSGYSFDGESWNLVGNEFNPTSFSSSPPLNPKAGDLWVDSDEDVDIIDDQNLVFQNDLDDYLSLSSASANYATKSYADNAVSSLVDSAPSTLNTLNELAAALGDDANFATTITNALSPVGSVTAYALDTPPAGWLLCDGTVHNISSYPALGAGLGSTYGGNGTTTFAVPNLKGRMPVGLDSAQTEFDSLGENGGEKSVTLTDSQMNHRHNFKFALNDNNYNATGSLAGMTQAGAFRYSDSSYSSAVLEGYITDTRIDGSSAVSGQSGRFASTGNTDTPTLVSPTAHNNLQPYIVMNYIIRAV